MTFLWESRAWYRYPGQATIRGAGVSFMLLHLPNLARTSQAAPKGGRVRPSGYDMPGQYSGCHVVIFSPEGAVRCGGGGSSKGGDGKNR